MFMASIRAASTAATFHARQLRLMRAARRSLVSASSCLLSFKPRTEQTVTDPEELERILLVAQRRGFAEEREENDVGVACLAVPLRGTPWATEAAISVTIPTARYTTARRAEIVAALETIIR